MQKTTTIGISIESDADVQLAKARKTEIGEAARAEGRAMNQAECMESHALSEAIWNYHKAKLDTSAGRATGPSTGIDFDMDELKRKDKAKTEMTDGRLRLVDQNTGRTITALEPNERFSVEANSDPFLTQMVFGRPEASMQRSDNFATGGVFAPEPLMKGLIDLSRNRQVCIAAGARSVNMESESMVIARATSDPEAEWRGEGQKVSPSLATFDSIRIVPKFLGCIVPVTVEMMDMAGNFESVIRNAIAAGMALTTDLYALRGPASGAGPTGIRYNSGVNLIDYADLGSVTNPFSPVSRAVRTILDENYPDDPSTLSMIRCPQLDESFDVLVDTTGQPLRPTPWYEKLKKLTTKQVPENLGDGTKTEVYVGDFSQMVLFYRSPLMIEVLREGVIQNSVTNVIEHNMVQEWKVAIRASWRVDVALMRPNWFTVLHNHPVTVS